MKVFYLHQTWGNVFSGQKQKHLTIGEPMKFITIFSLMFMMLAASISFADPVYEQVQETQIIQEDDNLSIIDTEVVIYRYQDYSYAIVTVEQFGGLNVLLLSQEDTGRSLNGLNSQTLIERRINSKKNNFTKSLV
jgi:hypothetical protein